MKRVLAELDALPPNAFCGLMLVGSPNDSGNEGGEFGKLYFGVTPHGAVVADGVCQEAAE